MSETETKELKEARANSKSSIVRWTLSDEWTQVERHDKPIPRGLVKKCGFLITTNQASGEIECPS